MTAQGAVPPEPDLVDFLSLEAVSAGLFRAHQFQANHKDAVYGGCLVAQALHAAELTAPGRPPHALHGHFHRPGRTSLPMDYEVETIRDGASFSSRRVSAMQGGKLVFEATISFHASETGFERAQAWSSEPPPPEAVPSLHELTELWRDRLPVAHIERISRFQGLETRILNAEDFLLRHSEPQGRFWVRPRVEPGRTVPSPYAAVAFASDFMMPGASYLPHTASTYDTDILALSLDHAIWFHSPLPDRDWMLHEVESPWAGTGRGLSFGRMYSRDGALVASTAQELLIRRQPAA